MNMETTLGLVRHLLTFGGGIVSAQGYADDATVQTIIGAVVTLAGAIWSVLAKRKG